MGLRSLFARALEDARVMLDAAKTTCPTVHEAIQIYVEPFPLLAPTEGVIGQVRTLVEKAAAA